MDPDGYADLPAADADGAAAGPNEQPPISKRIACVICRRRKLKCDGQRPSCSTCARLDHECVYETSRKKSGPKRGYIRELEDRVAFLETQLANAHSPGHGRSDSEYSLASPERPERRLGTRDHDPDVGIRELVSLGKFDTMRIGPNASLSPGSLYSQATHATRGSSAEASTPPELPGNKRRREENNPLTGVASFTSVSSDVDRQLSGNFASFNVHSDRPSLELMALGLGESLPPPQIVAVLENVFFQTFNSMTGLLHERRYRYRCTLPPQVQPPIYLRYAMWTISSSLVPEFESLVSAFYLRTRKYLEDVTLEYGGEKSQTVEYVQAYVLLAAYEYKAMYFVRAWQSVGIGARMAQLMHLNRLDIPDPTIKQCAQLPDSDVEREEQRRTFWSLVAVDRIASVGTGWPLSIDEEDIGTHLPIPEAEFAAGTFSSRPVSLRDALKSNLLSGERVATYAGFAVAMVLFGRVHNHLHKLNDVAPTVNGVNQAFIDRYHKLEKEIERIHTLAPEVTADPAKPPSQYLFLLHLSLNACSICLQQSTIFYTRKSAKFKRDYVASKQRSIAAATEVVHIVRAAGQCGILVYHMIAVFSYYLAARCFAQNVRLAQASGSTDYMSRRHFDFLVETLRKLLPRITMIHSFIAQLQIDVGEDIGGPVHGPAHGAAHAAEPAPVLDLVCRPRPGRPGHGL
ncbi:uncharacterized protein V1510DRAFT_419595 [Dipodascopsis tothii]|uniref:uncharacterized protein n=1 Tax=Dipodascopsis tothii TaxID=44089 RepID=UPI0034CDE700